MGSYGGVDIAGAFVAARAQIPAMRERGSGSMVLTGSFVDVTVAFLGQGAYAASELLALGLVADLGRANAAAFLASEQSSFMTGSTIFVFGGISITRGYRAT